MPESWNQAFSRQQSAFSFQLVSLESEAESWVLIAGSADYDDE